jgi:predicted ArsR family transcriptional regulator
MNARSHATDSSIPGDVVHDFPDRPLLDLIRREGPLTVAEMARRIEVTPTAIRNRLSRLVGSGMVERKVEHHGRGRPRHTYQASAETHRRLGQNYADLAVVLWEEMMRTIDDRKLRRALFARIIDRLAEHYRSEMRAESWQGRMVQLGSILHDRGVEAEVTGGEGALLPILRQHSCPYHALAEVDRAVCAMERKMFEKLLGQGLRISQCRLDGHRSCDFEAKPAIEPRLITIDPPAIARSRSARSLTTAAASSSAVEELTRTETD